MDTPTLWAVVYAQVISIRLHPKNDSGDRAQDLLNAHDIAERAANIAINTWRKKCQSQC
jgi:hypothetical protein